MKMTELRLLIIHAAMTTSATCRVVQGWMSNSHPVRRWRNNIVIQSKDLTDHARRRRSLCSHLLFSSSSSSSSSTMLSLQSQTIDYQSSEHFGRGEDHLSAFLQDGDVVVYQTGTWYVDGVQVGDVNNNNDDSDDSDTPSFRWAMIDTMQVVWTHNCEHGVLRGITLYEEEEDEDGDDNDKEEENQSKPLTEGRRRRLKTSNPLEFIEFGPEQLVARVPFEWDSDEQLSGITTVAAKDWEPL